MFTNGWYDDGIIEINSAGQIVWMWTVTDHLCQNFDPAKPNYVADVASAPGRLDINVVNYPTGPGALRPMRPQTTGLHVNSLNYNQALGYVALNSRST